MIYFILQCSLVYSCFKQNLGNYLFSIRQFMKNVNHILLWLRETQNALQLLVFFFFKFFCQPYPGLPNCKFVFLILKIWQYGRSRQLVQHFSRYLYKIWYKNWYLRSSNFTSSYIYRIWLKWGYSNYCWWRHYVKMTWQTKKNYLYYWSVYTHQPWQVGNLPWWAPAYKATWLFDLVILKDHIAN